MDEDPPPYRCPECGARGFIPSFIDHAEGCSGPTGTYDGSTFIEDATAEAERRRSGSD